MRAVIRIEQTGQLHSAPATADARPERDHWTRAGRRHQQFARPLAPLSEDEELHWLPREELEKRLPELKRLLRDGSAYVSRGPVAKQRGIWYANISTIIVVQQHYTRYFQVCMILGTLITLLNLVAHYRGMEKLTPQAEGSKTLFATVAYILIMSFGAAAVGCAPMEVPGYKRPVSPTGTS